MPTDLTVSTKKSYPFNDMIGSLDISPNEQMVLNDFIEKNEQKRRGLSVVAKGK